jgi:hypothetical protein
MSAVNEGAPAGERLGGVRLRDDRPPGNRLRDDDGLPGGQRPGSRMSHRRIRRRAMALTSLALAFYFGFIALTFYRSHH